MMTGKTTFGIRLPNSGPLSTPASILDLAVRAEVFSFDTVWVHDHISWAREKLTHFAMGSLEACADQDPNLFESVTTLAVVGGRLQRVKLGIAGLVLPLRDPRVLAKQIATVDRLTGGGRLIVACGIGAIPGDFDVMGVPWNRRGRMANDYLGALRAILDGEQPVTYESSSVSFENGEFYPRHGGIQIWIVGHSDAAYQRVAKYADGWLTAYASQDSYAEALKRLAELTEAAGRSPSELTCGLETYVTVGKTHDEAVSIAAKSLVNKFGTVEKGLQECIVGDVEEVTERIRGYHEIGVRHFELKFIGHTIPQITGMMEQIAERTLPTIRALEPVSA